MDGFERFEATSETKTIEKTGGIHMKKFFAKRLKNEKGLTLIELLAVIVILAIIAAIAVPAIGNVINNSKDKAILADASNILAGAKIAAVDGACGAATSEGVITCEQTELDGFVEGISDNPTYNATKNKEGVWSVTYSKLKNISTKGQTKLGIAANTETLTEAELNAALQK